MTTKLMAFAILLLSTIVVSTFGQDEFRPNDKSVVERLLEIQGNTVEDSKSGTVLTTITRSDSADDGDSPLNDPMFKFCLQTATAKCLDSCLNGWVCDEDVEEIPESFTLNPGSSTVDIPMIKAVNTVTTPGPTQNVIIKAPSTDTAAFAANINAQLSNKAVGYAFVIAKNGLLAEQGQGGFARMPVLDGGVPFTVNTDVNVYSVSKTITAIAILQLMEKLGILPDDPISDWLPQSWVKGPGFDAGGITFLDLLTHHTGVQQSIARYNNIIPGFADLSPNTWDGLKALVEVGIDPGWAQTKCATKDINGIYIQGAPASNEGYFAVYCYKNANYKLAAILIWKMALATGDITSNSELAADFDSAAGYQHYVRKNVLQPAGVDGFCYATGPESERALAYDINKNFFPSQYAQGGSMGGSFPGGLLSAGPKNWWLSAMDLAAVAAHLHYGNLLSPESRDLMDDLEMGWSASSNSASKPNRYWHGGLGMWTRNNRTQMLAPWHPANPTPSWLPSKVTTKDRVRTCFMKLPDGLDATIVMNSNVRGSSLDACGVLQTAFEDAQ